MLLTSEQHARLAEIYGRPDPNLSPEEKQAARRLSLCHAALAKRALAREEARLPHIVSAPLAPE
jgi:hypothetical protein